jgi:hypothetical protein
MSIYVQPYDLLTPLQRERVDIRARGEWHRAMDAAAMYREVCPDRGSRLQVVADLVIHGFFRQVELLGLVSCGTCGDQGCDLCGPDILVTSRNVFHLAPAWADEPTGLAVRADG